MCNGKESAEEKQTNRLKLLMSLINYCYYDIITDKCGSILA